jgi:hypothetical protein
MNVDGKKYVLRACAASLVCLAANILSVASGCGGTEWEKCTSDSDCGAGLKCINNYQATDCGGPCDCTFSASYCTTSCTTDSDCAPLGGACTRSSSCRGAKNVCEASSTGG